MLLKIFIMAVAGRNTSAAGTDTCSNSRDPRRTANRRTGRSCHGIRRNGENRDDRKISGDSDDPDDCGTGRGRVTLGCAYLCSPGDLARRARHDADDLRQRCRLPALTARQQSQAWTQAASPYSPPLTSKSNHKLDPPSVVPFAHMPTNVKGGVTGRRETLRSMNYGHVDRLRAGRGGGQTLRCLHMLCFNFRPRDAAIAILSARPDNPREERACHTSTPCCCWPPLSSV